jgi:hypothetical protein
MSGVVELRQYTLHPGARDTLIDLFEREFVESQEVCGITLIGTFRDADNSDRFVWLRGFADMVGRAHALAAFYGGPIWAAHRAAANATMIDSDNVLLLRPAWPGAGIAPHLDRVARADAREAPAHGIVIAQIHPIDILATAAFVAGFRATMGAAWREAGARDLAVYVTEPAANTYPALPVREGENVLVSCALFGAMPTAMPPLARHLSRCLASQVKTLRLVPTARSRWPV